MVEKGIIHSIDKKNRAEVRFPRKTACENCRMCLKPKDEMYVKVLIQNVLNAKVGDEVEVTMGNQIVLAASFIVYIIPALAVAVGLLLTRSLNEFVSLAIAIGALVLGFTAVALIDRTLKKNKKYIPQMTKIVAEDTENPNVSDVDDYFAEDKTENFDNKED